MRTLRCLLDIVRAKQKNRIIGSDPLGSYLDSVELGLGLVSKSWNRLQLGSESGPENLEAKAGLLPGPISFFF